MRYFWGITNNRCVLGRNGPACVFDCHASDWLSQSDWRIPKKSLVEKEVCAVNRLLSHAWPCTRGIIRRKLQRTLAQLAEWKDLFAIHEIDNIPINTDYTELLTVEFLKEQLKSRIWIPATSPRISRISLLSHFDDLDNRYRRLAHSRWEFSSLESIDWEISWVDESVFYIDPPYNTQTPQDFSIRTHYQTFKSWLSIDGRSASTLAEQFMASG